jgi:hypothetical protein
MSTAALYNCQFPDLLFCDFLFVVQLLNSHAAELMQEEQQTVDSSGAHTSTPGRE